MTRTAKGPSFDLTIDSIRHHHDRFAWAYRLFWGDHIHHGLFTDRKDKPELAQEELLRHCAARAGF